MTSDVRVSLSVFGFAAFIGAPADAPEPTAMQRRILERLAMNAPAPVSIEDLSSMLWDGEPPANARASIQNQISRIRATWGETVVRTTIRGYELGIDTDAQMLSERSAQAERLLEDGDARTAFDVAESVLPLWVGRPFSSLDHLGGVDAARRALNASCKGAENTRLAAGIALGRWAWAIGEAERLVAESPHDERRHAMLAGALAGAGRRGDALSALATARRVIRKDLGLDPGPHLRDAEEAVRGERRAGPLHDLPYVGRRAELRTVLTELAAHSIARVVGEAGSGLTRFVDTLAAQLGELGLRAVVVDALDHLDAADSLLQEILDELGVLRAGASVTAIPGALAVAAAERPLAILVDDAQAVGPTALSVLARAADQPGISVVLAGHGDRWLEDAASAIPLAALSTDDVAEVLGHMRMSSADAASVRAYTGGNPLALALFLAHGDDVPSDATHGGLAAFAAALLEDLDRAEREIVEQLAVADGDAAATMSDHVGRRASPSLAGIIEIADDRPRFRHGVLRDLVYRDIPRARREELHLAAARSAQRSGGPHAVVARHLVLASSLGEQEVVAACRRAAADAERVGAHADAAEWLATAEVHAEGRERLDVLIARGDAERLSGDPAHLDTLLQAAHEALGTGDEAVVSAASSALLQLGATSSSGAIDPRVASVIEAALAVVTTAHLRAPVSAGASLAWSLAGDARRSRAHFDDAERLATEPAMRATILPSAYMSLGLPHDLERRTSIAAELRTLGTDLADPVAAFEGWQLEASVALQRGDGDLLRRAETEMTERVDVVGDVGRKWALLFTRATIAHLDGDDERALRLTGEAEAVFRPVAPARAAATAAGQQLIVRLLQNRLGELVPTLQALVHSQPGLPAWHAALSLALAEAGIAGVSEHARTALDRAQPDVTWLATISIAGRAAAASSDDELIDRARGILDPWTGRAVWSGSGSYGPVDTVRALLLRAAGDEAGALAAARSAVEVAERLGAAPFLAEIAREFPGSMPRIGVAAVGERAD